MLKIYDLAINYQKEPTLVRCNSPKFSWKLDSDNTGVFQDSYEIKVYADETLIYNSERVYSDKSFDIGLGDLYLPEKSKIKVDLTVWDNNGESDSASISCFTEILPDSWKDAKWIKPKKHISGWAPYLRTKFTLGKIKSAKMYACGLGIAKYYINGIETDDYYIDVPATNYEIEVLYRCFDVTGFLREGGNAISVLLGEGFYSQSRVWGHLGFKFGDVCAKIYLEIELEDGKKQVIVTNTEDWKYKYSPICVNNIYAGETYDARIETPDFALYDGDDDEWGSVIEDTTPKGILTPCEMPPIREIRRLPAKTIRGSSGCCDGAYVFDLGENFAGTVEYHLPHSPLGAVYTFRYTEVLNESGSPDHRSTGAFATQCIQQDMYICKGDPKGEVYRPTLTYHGFRYVEITGIHDFSEGYGTMPKVSIVEGIQLSTDMKKNTSFSCSHKDLDKLMGIMDNTYRSNYHGFPEDCPAREKCGWLGDAQICVNYGLLTYDAVSSYRKYLDDIRATTKVFGVWQMTSPGKRGCGEASPLWGCAQVVIPYFMYKYCGDKDAVYKNFDLIEKWVKHELDRSDDYIIDVGLGDWCPPGGNKGEKRIPVIHSSTFEFYEICKLTEELCLELDIGDSKYYSDLADKVKDSIIRHFYDKDNHTYNYHASNAVALYWGIYPDVDKEHLLNATVKSIVDSGYEMQTGIYGCKYLAPVLMENGYGDVALKYFFSREHTSFATMMDDSATTIWENLDMTHVTPYKEGTISSYNHPMLGGWLYVCYTNISGLKQIDAGYKSFRFAPDSVTLIDKFDTVLDTTAGKISVSKNNNVYSLTVPANTTCVVDIDACSITSNNGEKYSAGESLASGKYTITINK